MSHYIKSIAEVSRYLDQMRKIKADGEYLGAGLSVSLCVGAPTEDSTIYGPLDIGAMGEPEALLNILIQSLEQSRTFRIKTARDEVARLSVFLEDMK